jgi:hypothetical protein
MSQNREKIEDSDYELVEKRSNGSAVIFNPSLDNYELYQQNDHYSGWVLVIDGIGYEFVRDLHESETTEY